MNTINDIEKMQVSVESGWIKLTVNEKVLPPDFTCKIYDALGNVVYETSFSRTNDKETLFMDISHLSVGTYQLLVFNEEHPVMKKKIFIRK